MILRIVYGNGVAAVSEQVEDPESRELARALSARLRTLGARTVTERDGSRWYQVMLAAEEGTDAGTG